MICDDPTRWRKAKVKKKPRGGHGGRPVQQGSSITDSDSQEAWHKSPAVALFACVLQSSVICREFEYGPRSIARAPARAADMAAHATGLQLQYHITSRAVIVVNK